MTALAGRLIVITGAGSGIGRALALACAQRGARLFLADIDEASLSAAAGAARALGATVETQVVDCGDEASIVALAGAVQLFGGADILVNNAGVGLVAPVEALTTADAHWLMNINFWGVVHGCRAFLPQLRTRPDAMIVNVSSIFAMISVPTQSIYNAAKAAVRAFSDALREELRDTPIKVLCVHPGGIRTNILNSARIADVPELVAGAGAMRRHFTEKSARTSPEEAALAIVGAIEGNRTRLLIGADARIADFLYRLLPARASALISARLRRDQESARQAAQKPHTSTVKT